MLLEKEQIPKWKQKKKYSFDAALKDLGPRKAFIQKEKEAKILQNKKGVVFI